MGLEVEPFSRRVGREEDSKRVLRRLGVEAALDLPAVCALGEAVDHLYSFFRPISHLDCLLQEPLEPCLRPFTVLRENEDTAVVPLRFSVRALSEGRERGA